MRIVYVAALDAGLADDEGAILHALRELGHEVLPLREEKGHAAENLIGRGPDLLLFHKWCNPATLQRFRGVCPRAFWWFDLVQFPADPTLGRRDAQRRDWMAQVTPHVEFGFMSDGDWAASNPEKYRVLYQGADERVAGRGEPACPLCRSPAAPYDLLLTCIDRGGGERRMSFVREMKDRYGDRLHHVTRGLYREGLRSAVAAAKIVVCPDAPVTDRYWSNRVWNAAGFGGCVLHPLCDRLAADGYTDGVDLYYYRDRDHMHQLIDELLGSAELRRVVGDQALETTRRKHLYRHRCEQLLRTVTGAA